MDEKRKPPPKRGRESREGRGEKPKGEVNPRHDRIERAMGPLRPDPADDQYFPHAKTDAPPGTPVPPIPD